MGGGGGGGREASAMHTFAFLIATSCPFHRPRQTTAAGVSQMNSSSRASLKAMRGTDDSGRAMVVFHAIE